MKHILFFGLISVLLSGCVRNNPKPVWLDISEWTIESNDLSEEDPGFLSHNFTDVWVYADNKLIGVFELPCKIPILITGNNKSIRLYPTIRNNGISATKKIYPFCEPFEQNYDLTSGTTIQIAPVTRYYSNCQFWLEDFESSSTNFATDQDASTASMTFENNSSIALSGKYAHIALNNSTDSVWYGVTEMVDLPQGGKEVYLEVEYRSTIPILQGVLSVAQDLTTVDNAYVSIQAQDASSATWKKIYIDLKEIVSYYTSALGFKNYLKAEISDSEGAPTDVYIDNIRLVYF